MGADKDKDAHKRTDSVTISEEEEAISDASSVIRDDYDGDAALISRPALQSLLADLRKFMQGSGIQPEPNHDRERELMEEIERLRQENTLLRNALVTYRQAAPEVKPPPFMAAADWAVRAQLL